MQWQLTSFQEFSADQLYRILQLRTEVFVVEQACAYLEVDGKDKEALHLTGIANGQIEAYARLLPPGTAYEEASIGRVIVRKEYRGTGLGRELLTKSLEGVYQHFNVDRIKIQAQEYALPFYKKAGFVSITEPYDDDGILHVDMVHHKKEK
ncbi:GNAT family N-acetyltransferase [Alkalicoccus luteus]|uniref:GNAT family N-acetyltransferase n=1 Tax=Alkalicoccus luteus TaxID=1237094 RepID=A0A969PSZ6_9BACI|nr:GNAT family N-acetyltransferase [Alkalicoccus luteus]NJP38534.1 GNAT family N-acetyltransferase [Alkalicoccus luteus]